MACRIVIVVRTGRWNSRNRRVVRVPFTTWRWIIIRSSNEHSGSDYRGGRSDYRSGWRDCRGGRSDGSLRRGPLRNTRLPVTLWNVSFIKLPTFASIVLSYVVTCKTFICMGSTVMACRIVIVLRTGRWNSRNRRVVRVPFTTWRWIIIRSSNEHFVFYKMQFEKNGY